MKINSKLTLSKRQPIIIKSDDSVKYHISENPNDMPIIILPKHTDMDFCAWLKSNKEDVEKMFSQYGVLLFREFTLGSALAFKNAIMSTSTKVLSYKERSSPRTEIIDNIYTSTDYNCNQEIFPHNEHSYSKTFPQKIYFYCDLACSIGGNTPLVNCLKLTKEIPDNILDKFNRLGWKYVRNYNNHIGLHWSVVFQSDQRSVVESYCHDNAIKYKWCNDNGLRTSQVRPTMIRHPNLLTHIWFNHAVFFNVNTLDTNISQLLLDQYNIKNVPHNTYYGDGSPIEVEVIETLKKLYLKNRIEFNWQVGDFLMVDNIRYAHSRRAFQGERRILVGMADPLVRTDLVDGSEI